MTRVFVFGVIATVAASVSGAFAADRVLDTQTGPIRVETFSRGLEHPWGLAFLPDGRMLVTERPGRLRLASADGRLSEPLAGTPEVFAEGQGGLLDVALDPDFSSTGRIYLCYAEPGEGGAGTAAAGGRLTEHAIDSLHVFFRQQPKVNGANHFGCRIVFARDGTLFITLGERFKFMPAQDLTNDLGKIVRINRDGSIPPDNPFANDAAARPEIWSYGHRNVQGAALNPQTGALWTDEFGPRGGDEINIVEAGRNYGWPLVSWGSHYSGQAIAKPPTRPDLAGAIYHWTPSISPSGMTFYTADLFSAWRGNLLLGGLSSESLVRLVLDGDRVIREERIEMGKRIRHVRQGPEGAVYLLTDEDDGEILRLIPARRQ